MSESESDSAPQRRQQSMTGTPSIGVKFACPYFKKNPRRYNLERPCCGPGFSSVKRVKEHLFRKHGQRIVCLRCGRTFERVVDLDVHRRSPTVCREIKMSPAALPESMDEKQEKLLRSRKSPPGVKMEPERWFEIYEVLFPGSEHPESPFHMETNILVEQPSIPIHSVDSRPNEPEIELRNSIRELLDRSSGTEQTSEQVADNIVVLLRQWSLRNPQNRSAHGGWDMITPELMNSSWPSTDILHPPEGQGMARFLAADMGTVTPLSTVDAYGLGTVTPWPYAAPLPFLPHTAGQALVDGGLGDFPWPWNDDSALNRGNNDAWIFGGISDVSAAGKTDDSTPASTAVGVDRGEDEK